jgi:hypothetical protein
VQLSDPPPESPLPRPKDERRAALPFDRRHLAEQDHPRTSHRSASTPFRLTKRTLTHFTFEFSPKDGRGSQEPGRGLHPAGLSCAHFCARAQCEGSENRTPGEHINRCHTRKRRGWDSNRGALRRDQRPAGAAPTWRSGGLASGSRGFGAPGGSAGRFSFHEKANLSMSTWRQRRRRTPIRNVSIRTRREPWGGLGAC